MKSSVNKLYILNQKREYTLLVENMISKLRTENIENYLYNQIAEDLIKEVQKKELSDAMYLTIVPASFMINLIDDVSKNVRQLLSIRFRKQIETLWSEGFSTGKKHTVSDMLANIKPFSKALLHSESKFNSLLSNGSLVDFVSKDTNTAEFEDPTDKTRALRIARAKRTLTILKANKSILESSGQFDNINTSAKTSSRYTVNEKINYLTAILEIEDFINKSDRAEKDFLGDDYFTRRYKVLTDDYLTNYDTYIKDQLSSYLKNNIEGIRQIKATEGRSQTLINNISASLKNSDVTRVDPVKKSEAIVRTELSIAYNFGKLSGFASSGDSQRLFRWRADWELEGKKDYEVCQYCSSMDGRIYTAEQLMRAGTQLDRGVLRYEGKTRTSWKNPNLPSIPGHVNCLVAGTSITMYNKNTDSYYYKNIEDVTIGEYVKVPTSAKYQKVIKTHKNWYAKQIFKIRSEDGQVIYATGNHPIWDGTKWKDTKDFSVGDYIFVSNQSNSKTYEGDLRQVFNTTRKYLSNKLSFKMQQSINYVDFRVVSDKKNGKRNESFICKYSRKEKSFFREDEKEQSYSHTGSSGENEKVSSEKLGRSRVSSKDSSLFTKEQLSQQSRDKRKNQRQIQISRIQSKDEGIEKRHYPTKSPLFNAKWKRSLQMWCKRGFKSLLQKWVGSECSQNIEQIKYKVGVRKNNIVRRFNKILPRFLFTGMGYIFRSKGLLDRESKNKVRETIERKTGNTDGVDRSVFLQESNNEFQGLSRIRVEEISFSTEAQFVYNLSVDEDPMYFANDILVHNCNCFWQILPKDYIEEDEYGRAREPIEKTTITSGNVVDNLLPNAIGTGLILGGTFLLARSNAWRIFIDAAKTVDAGDVIDTTTEVTKQIINIGKYVGRELTPVVQTTFKEVIKELVT